jgi:hypothetical protein
MTYGPREYLVSLGGVEVLAVEVLLACPGPFDRNDGVLQKIT